MTQTGTSAPTALDALTPDEQLAASRRREGTAQTNRTLFLGER